MRSKILISVVVAAVVGLCFGTCCNAQDWLQKDSKHVKLIADTTRLCATVVTVMPGEKGKDHVHPAHFFYALTDCKLVVHYKDGENVTYDLKAGDGGYSDPEREHWTENVGKKECKFLLIELKK